MKFIIAFVLFLAACAIDIPCIGNVYDPETHRTYEFDLSSLHHDETSASDPYWYRTDNDRIYYVNFCGQSAAGCEHDDTSVCIREPNGTSHHFFSGGATSSQTMTISELPDQTPSTSVTVTYSHGEKCGNGHFTTKIYINCQPTADPGYFYGANYSDPCESVLYMWAAAGCGRDVTSSSSMMPSDSSIPEPDDCSAIVKDEANHRAYFFNLSSLHHDDTTLTDPLWYRTDDNIMYYVNFCGQTSHCDSDDTSVCIRFPDGPDYKYVNGGSTSTQTISIAEMPGSSPRTSVTVTYTNGDKCGNGYYKTKMYINCQETADPGYFYDINRTNECEVTLYMWSAAGCGTRIPYPEYSSSSSFPYSSFPSSTEPPSSSPSSSSSSSSGIPSGSSSGNSGSRHSASALLLCVFVLLFILH